MIRDEARAVMHPETAAEIEFLDGLGTWCEFTRQPRRELLRLYLQGCKLRSNWRRIDSAAVIAHATMLLGAAA